MFLGFHDNFRLAVLINFVLIKKSVGNIGQMGNLIRENQKFRK